MRIRNRNINLKYIVVAAILLFLLANRGFRNLASNYLEFRNLRKEKVRLEKEAKELQKKLKQINDPLYIERVARIELGMKRPDETEYRFKPDEKAGQHGK